MNEKAGHWIKIDSFDFEDDIIRVKGRQSILYIKERKSTMIMFHGVNEYEVNTEIH
jgi:hypothetical protein